MMLFFAGCESKHYAMRLKECGVQRSLQSAFYLNFKTPPNAELKAPFFLLDSGGFTAIKKGIDIPAKQYADYINAHGVKVAFNMDVTDTAQTLKNQKFLEKHTDAYIIPVFHYHEYTKAKWRDLIISFAKDYPLISIGGNPPKVSVTDKCRFYDYCFSKVGLTAKIHGLGITRPESMKDYPWFSIDSTTWLATERYGEYHEFRGDRVMKFRSVRVKKKLVDPRQLLDGKARTMRTIKAFLQAEDYVTRYWKRRGVVWDTKPFK